MVANRSKKSILNMIWGMVQRFTSMFFPFIIRSIIIYTLGKQYLGLNSLFISILSVLSLSELGIGNALVYNMYEPVAKGDNDRVCKLLNVYKQFYRLIGFIVLISGLILMPFLKYFINGTYPSDINIYLLYLIYLFNSFLTYTLFSYKTSILQASQDNRVESCLLFLSNLIMYLFQILALLFTKNYYVYLIIVPISTLLLNISRSIYVDKNYKQYKCGGSHLSKEELKIIFKDIRALIGHKIGTTVILSADTIVLSSFLGLDVVAIYGNYCIIINSVIGLVNIFYTSILASVGNCIVTESCEKNYNQFLELNFINMWIICWCTVCLYCLYQPFMNEWMGSDMLFSNSTVILFCIYFYSRQIRRIGLTYEEAAGMWKYDFWKPYIGIIVNIIGDIILVLLIGVDGILIPTIIVMVFVYFPFECKVIHKYIFKKQTKQYVMSIIFNMIVTVFLCFITKLLCDSINLNGFLNLIVCGIVCVIIPNLIFVIIYIKNRQFNAFLNRIVNFTYKK